jgi:DNA repair protein SbcC/Rad50
MINSLHITNFQSWEDVELDFHPGLNIIVGLSDNGKSAIIRALKWLILNRPLGNEFQSTWGGKTSVELTTSEKIKITRSQNENGDDKIYSFSTIKSPFKAFGTEVPKEISDVLNISEINLHQQQDSFFLLKNTPGEVAQHFNKVANLSKIDTATQNIQKWINQLSSIIGVEELKNKPATGLIKDLRFQENELLKFAHLDKFESEVEILEDLENKLNLEAKNRQRLSDLIDEIENILIEIEEKEKILEIDPILNRVLDLIEKRNKEKNDASKLNLLVSGIKIKQKQIEEKEKIIPTEILIDKLINLFKDKEQEEKNQYQLNKLIQHIENGDKVIKEAEQFYAKLHNEFKKEMGDVCLLCGTKLK